MLESSSAQNLCVLHVHVAVISPTFVQTGKGDREKTSPVAVAENSLTISKAKQNHYYEIHQLQKDKAKAVTLMANNTNRPCSCRTLLELIPSLTGFGLFGSNDKGLFVGCLIESITDGCELTWISNVGLCVVGRKKFQAGCNVVADGEGLIVVGRNIFQAGFNVGLFVAGGWKDVGVGGNRFGWVGLFDSGDVVGTMEEKGCVLGGFGVWVGICGGSGITAINATFCSIISPPLKSKQVVLPVSGLTELSASG